MIESTLTLKPADSVSYTHLDVYKRQVAVDPFNFYPKLGVENDASHAFYLGVELARAQIAWQLNKRYVQDETLMWGVNSRMGEGLNVGVEFAGFQNV